MSENPFLARRKAATPAPVAGGSTNPFLARRKQKAVPAQESPVDVPQETVFSSLSKPIQTDLGPQEVNIAEKTNLGGPNETQKMLGNPYSPMMQGMTLGASDEIMAGLGAPIDSAINMLTGKGPTSISENFSQLMAQQAAEKAAYEKENPTRAIVGEFAGGLVAGGPAAKIISAAPGYFGKVGRSIAVGGGSGAFQGFASADGGLEDRTRAGLVGGAVGGVVGGVLPPIFDAAKAVVKASVAPLKSALNPEKFATRKVAEAISRDGMSLDRVSNRLVSNAAIKGDLAIADVAGVNSADLLRAAANVPSERRRFMLQQLDYRQGNQLKRLEKDISTAFGETKSFYAETEKLLTQRRTAAKPMFDQAFATPTPYTVDLQNVLKRPLTSQLVERARIAAANRGEKFKNIFVTIDDSGAATARRVIDTEGLHRVKMTIDEMIGGMKRGEDTGLKNVNIRDLTILKKDLMGAIENQPYKTALAHYSGDSAMVSSLEDGFKNGMKLDPQEITSVLRNLSMPEQKLWRLGFARSIADSLRDAGRNGTNRADILASPKFEQRILAAIPNIKARRDLIQAIKLEQRMYRTRNAAIGNSTTAKQLAQADAASVDAQDGVDILNATKDLATGNAFGAAIKIISRAKNMAKGMSPEVADEIIRLLTTKKPTDIQKAKQLIKKQELILLKKNGRSELLTGLRAISAGLLGGRVDEAAQSYP